MLSSKHLLKNNRYSIERTVSTGPAGTIYLAVDTLRKTTVAIIERCDNAQTNEFDSSSLARTQHEGLVRINDDFEERSCRYSATEPLATSKFKIPSDGSACDELFGRLGAVLLALNAVRSDSDTSVIEISPENLVLTADEKLKLLYAGSTGFVTAGFEPTSPFMPLEMVWDRLDHITQKAIYNSYDEATLAELESPADLRTEIYSLGALFYRCLTGKEPVPAVDRAIEMLDSNADSLKSPAALNPAINAEQSDFIMRMLEVKRGRRFGSIEDAIFSLPLMPDVKETQSVSVVPEPDEFPLLEIPLMAAVSQAPVTVGNVQVLETPLVDVATAFHPPFPANRQSERSNPVPTTKPMPVVREDKEVFTTYDAGKPVGGSVSMKPIAIAAGALVVAVGIGWAVFSGSAAKQADSTASMAAPQAVVQEPQPSSTIEPSQPAIDTTNSVVETGNDPIGPQSAKPKPQIADVKAKPVKDTKPKNETKPAKKLTVDDLIN